MVRELIAAKQKEGLSASSIRNILAPIRSMYNQAIDDGEAFRNPASRIGKFNNKKDSKPVVDPLTRTEVQLMLDKALSSFAQYYPLFLCAVRAGLRQGELIEVRGTDLDFNESNGRFIHVQRRFYRGKVGRPKSGKTRRVDMSKQLAAVLEELLSHRRSTALRAEMSKSVDERRDAAKVVNEVMEGLLFTTSQGTRLDPDNLRRMFGKLLIAAKLRRIRFHDLRHTFASLLLQNGESLVYVKDQMGHSSIKVTVDTYGHLVPGGNRAAVDRLDERVTITPPDTAATA